MVIMKKKSDRHLKPILGLRIEKEIIDLFKELAKKNRRTLTAQVSIALEEHLSKAGMWPVKSEVQKE